MYVLTQNKAHEFVGQDAGGDKGHPQTNVQLLSDLRLHPHEQTATHTHTHITHRKTSYPSYFHKHAKAENVADVRFSVTFLKICHRDELT